MSGNLFLVKRKWCWLFRGVQQLQVCFLFAYYETLYNSIGNHVPSFNFTSGAEEAVVKRWLGYLLSDNVLPLSRYQIKIADD